MISARKFFLAFICAMAAIAVEGEAPRVFSQGDTPAPRQPGTVYIRETEKGFSFMVLGHGNWCGPWCETEKEAQEGVELFKKRIGDVTYRPIGNFIGARIMDEKGQQIAYRVGLYKTLEEAKAATERMKVTLGSPATAVSVNPVIVPTKDSTSEADLLFSFISDSYRFNERTLSPKRDPEGFAKLLKSSDPAIRNLAHEGAELVKRRSIAKATHSYWQTAATDPKALQKIVAEKIANFLPAANAPDGGQRFADELAAALRISRPNNTRVAAAGDLTLQLGKLQSLLPPVLETRSGKAPLDRQNDVTLKAVLEKQLPTDQSPAEMILSYKGEKPLRNVLVGFHLETKRPPNLSPVEAQALAGAYMLGGKTLISTILKDQVVAEKAMSLGSRNLVFIPMLKTGDYVRIQYELGMVRSCTSATFWLDSADLKIPSREIEGIKEMQAEINGMFGPPR